MGSPDYGFQRYPVRLFFRPNSQKTTITRNNRQQAYITEKKGMGVRKGEYSLKFIISLCLHSIVQVALNPRWF